MSSSSDPQRASAAPASPRTDGRTLALLLAMYGLLLGNAALYWTSPLPLPVHVLLSAVGIHLAFTIWHEAAHRTVDRRGWVNDLVGVIGIFPYMAPFFIQKYVHLQHHSRLNRADDPNMVYADGSFATIFFRYPRALRYAKQVLAADPRTRSQQWVDYGSLALLAGIWLFAWWQGAFLDLVWLWLVPFAIAKLVMDWYVNWLPHVGLPADRYRGTRVVEVPWLTPLILAHNYHAVHHLWPQIPWHRYRGVFEQRRETLRENGVPIEHHVFGRRPAEPAADALPG